MNVSDAAAPAPPPFLPAMPVFYECQRCTACCRWPGQVRVSPAEITALAAYLGLSEEDFIQRYTRLAANRKGLALGEREDGACIFLQGNDCRVQPVKPQQCRDFPNLWRFPGVEKVCQARAVELSPQAYVQRVAQATGRPATDPLIQRQLELQSSDRRPGGSDDGDGER